MPGRTISSLFLALLFCSVTFVISNCQMSIKNKAARHVNKYVNKIFIPTYAALFWDQKSIYQLSLHFRGIFCAITFIVFAEYKTIS